MNCPYVYDGVFNFEGVFDDARARHAPGGWHLAAGLQSFSHLIASLRAADTCFVAPSSLAYALLTAAHRATFRWQARREIGRLREIDSAAAHTLAVALADALRPASDAASAWIARIEALRARLRASADVLTYQDFGAGGRLQAAAPHPAARPVRVISRAAVPPHEARVLFEIVRHFEPARCLELGTSLGISAAYLAAALSENGGGHLVTLEGGEALADHARENLGALGLGGNAEVVAGRFADTLPGVLEAYGPFDFVFLDGHHDPDATLGYLEKLWPHLRPGALLVLDDLAWTSGMRRAWNTLRADPRFGLTADLLVFGIAVAEARS